MIPKKEMEINNKKSEKVKILSLELIAQPRRQMNESANPPSLKHF